MENRKSKRQEKYHPDLTVDGFFNLPPAHADFLHDLIPVPVLKSFGNLLIVDNQYGCHQEQTAEENSKEEEASVKHMEIFFVDAPEFQVSSDSVIILNPVGNGLCCCLFFLFASGQIKPIGIFHRYFSGFRQG